MTIEQQKQSSDDTKKSDIQSDLDRGTVKVGGEERRVTKVARKTKEGKDRHLETEESRKKEEDARIKEKALIKATLKEKGTGQDDGSDEDGWESVEEDYPHIKFDDLKDLEKQLAGMKIKGEGDDDEYDEEDEHDLESLIDEEPMIVKRPVEKKKEEEEVKKGKKK